MTPEEFSKLFLEKRREDRVDRLVNQLVPLASALVVNDPDQDWTAEGIASAALKLLEALRKAAETGIALEDP